MLLEGLGDRRVRTDGLQLCDGCRQRVRRGEAALDGIGKVFTIFPQLALRVRAALADGIHGKQVLLELVFDAEVAPFHLSHLLQQKWRHWGAACDTPACGDGFENFKAQRGRCNMR